MDQKSSRQMIEPLAQYYRCPERYLQFALKGSLSESNGYFRFGKGTVCYGRRGGEAPSAHSPAGPLHDATQDVSCEKGVTYLPFDLAEVADNLRHELYAGDSWHERSLMRSAISRAYYFVRPILPVSVRKHLQKIRLNGWHQLRFPHWPVDRTVDNLFEHLLLLALRSQGLERIPFIWFWPDGASSCAIMTHDVETTAGRDFCTTLMDLDSAYGISASFQIVPERRYEVPEGYLESIRARGFEVLVQDLNHDGHLFRERRQFLARAARINAYARQYGATGFRSAVLYRRQHWFDALEFSYDMSVPNVAHLDPQRGGCCTVMPYFVGKVLELPVTTTQDYSLFHILNDYSIDLWKRQIDLIMEKHGLISFIVHPDYIISDRERQTYESLLGYLAQLKTEKNIWIPTPREVDSWWRNRMEMRLVERGDQWRIEGPSSDRARIAYASEKDGRLVVTLDAGQAVHA